MANQYNYENIVLKHLPHSIVVTGIDGVIQLWNPAAETIYNITAADAIGKKIDNVLCFTYLNTTPEEVAHQLSQNKIWEGEVSFQNKEKDILYLLQTVTVTFDDEGNEIGTITTARDITQQKHDEQRLLQSEEFYRSLVQGSLDMLLLINAEGNITFATPSVKELLGYEINEVVGGNAFSFVHPDDTEFAFQSFAREVEERPEVKFVVIRLLKKSGEWLWCMARGHNLLKTPSVQSIAIYIHDDTPRKQATDALKQNEQRFRNLIRDLRIGILLQDAEGNTVMTNNALKKMFDQDDEHILGKKVSELYSDVIHEDGSRFLLNERPALKAIQTRRLVQDVVMGVWHKEKMERIWVLMSADPLLDAEGNILNIVCSFTDITERKKLEKKIFAEEMTYQRQLAQATIDGQEKERLEIGTELHDNIGQQLTTIKLYLELAKTTVDEETKRMIEMALKRIMDAINDVRSISHSLVPPTLKDLGFIDSVNDLVDSLQMVQPIFIELDCFDFDEDGLPENKKLALFRIIQEQLNNITRHANAQNVSIQLSSHSDHVLLTIEDDGNGFDLAKIRRGLGFSNMINRAEFFNGRVEINTTPGNGCKIKVWIPHTFSSMVFEDN